MDFPQFYKCFGVLGRSGGWLAASATAPEGQKYRTDAPRPGLFLVSGRRLIGRAFTPVRSAARGPVKGAVGQDLGQRPTDIAPVIAGHPQFGTGRHGPGQKVQLRAGYEAALGVAGLGPGIGKQHENPAQGARRQDIEQGTGVIGQDTDIGEIPGGNELERRRDPVDEGFAADQPDIRMGRRLGGEMDAIAETDLKPDLGRGCGSKQGAGIKAAGGRISGIDAQARQQINHQRRPRCLERSADTATIKPARGRGGTAGAGHVCPRKP